MTVQELIDLLKCLDKNEIVGVYVEESGYISVTRIDVNVPIMVIPELDPIMGVGLY